MTRRPFTFLLTLSVNAALLGVGLAQDRVNDPTSFTWNPELSKGGPVVVTVYLGNQTAMVHRGGVLIGSCLVSTGRPGYETPTGVFHILEKDADHHSSTYNNASMPFTERLTWGGVALHAGGLPGYPSSHGCVHLPYEFSRKLFEITEVGTTVVVTEGNPAKAVSTGHRIEFAAHEDAEVALTPHDSPDGPVSILFSEADKKVVVVRNGVVIGSGPAHHKPFAEKAKGTYAFVCDGWANDSEGAYHPSWHQVSGPPDSHLIKSFAHLQMDPRLAHVVNAVLKPGATLVMTEDPLSAKTRSDPGFLVMQGALAKK